MCGCGLPLSTSPSNEGSSSVNCSDWAEDSSNDDNTCADNEVFMPSVAMGAGTISDTEDKNSIGAEIECLR